MDEVPEEAIQAVEAEGTPGGHDHTGVTGEDGTLRGHLEEIHQLDVPSGMSPSTQTGLHDRLHDESGAVDD